MTPPFAVSRVGGIRSSAAMAGGPAIMVNHEIRNKTDRRMAFSLAAVGIQRESSDADFIPSRYKLTWIPINPGDS
jgi:hypothetical protein